MKKVGNLLEAIAKDAGFAESFQLGKIQVKWEKLFPPPVCLHSKPVFYKNGILVINVSSNLWLTELRYKQTMILAKLKDFKVKDIKLQFGEVAKPGEEIKQPKRKTTSQKLEETHKIKELQDFINNTSNKIKDPELREIIQEAMKKTLLHR